MRKDYLGAVAAGALIGVALPAFSIYFEQLYGIALFFGIPTAIGFVVSAVLRRFGARPLRDSMLCTFGAAFVASLGFLVMGREGLICVFMAVPIASPFLAIGALLGYFAFHRRHAPVASAVVMLLIVATMIHIEAKVRREPRLEIVEDSVLIHATPAEVWSSVVALDAVPRPRNWMYRVGLACPQRTRIQSQRAGGYRVCTLSTGQLVEQIEVWRPEHVLRWHSRITPPPMHELNPLYRHVDAPHLHGYYDSPRGEFAIGRMGPHHATDATHVVLAASLSILLLEHLLRDGNLADSSYRARTRAFDG